MNNANTENDYLILNSCIQKTATGPEYSQNLSYSESYQAMRFILSGQADPVQTAIFFISLRMKRETQDENAGIFQAIFDCTEKINADVDEIADIADPYDGYLRCLPMSPFIPAVLSSRGLAAVSHGVDSMGPKFGATHRRILDLCGIEVDLSPNQVAKRIADPNIGWGYVDQSHYCPRLFALSDLRKRMIKRPVLSTVEALTGPIRGRRKTHLLTGYVHKAYPEVYSALARQSGFESAFIVRGVEGGVVPSLKQSAKAMLYYGDQPDAQRLELNPELLDIKQSTRAVPLPDYLTPSGRTSNRNALVQSICEMASETGLDVLSGKAGPARDCLIYGSAIILAQTKSTATLIDAAKEVRLAIDSGKALEHFNANLRNKL